MERILLLSLTTDTALSFQHFKFWTLVSQLKRHSELPPNYWMSIPLKFLKLKTCRNSPEVVDLQKWAASAQNSETNYWLQKQMAFTQNRTKFSNSLALSSFPLLGILFIIVLLPCLLTSMISLIFILWPIIVFATWEKTKFSGLFFLRP